MSDTPRTDAELRKPIHDTGIHNNLTEFCQELERENNELRKDKERLDWLFHEDNEMGCVVICYWDKDKECYAERTLMTRSELDQAMEEE